MNEESIKYLEYLKANTGWKKEVLDLVCDDLEFGLTKEQVKKYAKKENDIDRMRLYSECLRRGYSEEVMDTLVRDEVDIYRCKVAVEFYGLGIPLEKVAEVMDGAKTAKQMQDIFKAFLANKEKLEDANKKMPLYAQELIRQIKEIVSQIQYHEEFHNDLQELLNVLADAKKSEETIDHLYQVIRDREAQIRAKQDELNEGYKKVAQQREQMERLEQELKKMGEIVNNLEARLPAKETPASNPATDKIPVHYTVPVMKQEKVVGRVQLEHTKKRSNTRNRIMAKLCVALRPGQDIVKKVIDVDLSAAQLVQVRMAMEKGLTDSQLNKIIDNKISTEKMKEIIELAVLINRNK